LPSIVVELRRCKRRQTMNRSRSSWLLVVFGLVLLLAGVGPWPRAGWTQTVPPPPLPAVHPLYGDCEEDAGGTVPPPVFEPFLPNSIYVDWCGQALLTIAPPGVGAASLPAGEPGFDPAVGHRIGLFYHTADRDDDDEDRDDDGETGWFIAKYSYRVDFDDFEDLRERKVALLREICPLGNSCNELLLAKLGKLSAEWSVLNAAGEQQINPLNKIFVPYVSNQD
jgi:hypothetical protein